MVLNGALAGLVSITAEPLMPSLGLATIIGAIGGIIIVFSVPILDKLKIDDVVGAISVHGIAGIWGTLAVVLSNSDASFGTQLLGTVSICLFTFVVSYIAWLILDMLMGARVSEESEIDGTDGKLKQQLGSAVLHCPIKAKTKEDETKKWKFLQTWHFILMCSKMSIPMKDHWLAT